MVSLQSLFPFRRTCIFLSLLFCTLPVIAQGALKTINPPQGGTIIYGQVDGQTTESGAMGAVLKSVHQNVGEKPQVGKLFEVHGTQSVAAFFSATRRNGNGGQVGGIVIVTKVSTDHVEAALITDEATRFHKNISGYMKTLFAAWHPLVGGGSAHSGSGGSAHSGSGGGPVAPLHQVVMPDNSASAKIPEGWHVVPNLSGGGTICAVGPDGESALMNITFLANDPRNPTVQQTLRQLQMGQLRNTSYAQASYIAYGLEPAKTFEYLFNKSRNGAGNPPADFKFTGSEPMAPMGQNRCAHLTGTVDFKDQKGVREMNTVFCEEPPNNYGGWLSSSYVTAVPMALAAKERATMGAIMASFQVNQGVVQSEAARIAAPAIAQIHAIGAAAAAQRQASNEAFEIHNSSVYKTWDSQDKRSQEFENYQLGYSVIQDNSANGHGTFWNEDADALVKSNPNRFEYVNAPNYWKGIDY